jgi:hypothetical protein
MDSLRGEEPWRETGETGIHSFRPPRLIKLNLFGRTWGTDDGCIASSQLVRAGYLCTCVLVWFPPLPRKVAGGSRTPGSWLWWLEGSTQLAAWPMTTPLLLNWPRYLPTLQIEPIANPPTSPAKFHPSIHQAVRPPSSTLWSAGVWQAYVRQDSLSSKPSFSARSHLPAHSPSLPIIPRLSLLHGEDNSLT